MSTLTPALMLQIASQLRAPQAPAPTAVDSPTPLAPAPLAPAVQPVVAPAPAQAQVAAPMPATSFDMVPPLDESRDAAAVTGVPLSMKSAAKDREVATTAADQALRNGYNVAQRRSVIEAAMAAEMDAPMADYQARIAENEAKMAQIVEQGRLAGERQAQRVRMAADMAAQSDVKDFWADKSSLAKAMGLISQMLCGASNAIAGQPGAPTALDRIIATDMEKQRVNLQKNQMVADREQSLLHQVYKDTGSMVAAQAAMTDAAYQKLQAAAKAMANRYGTELAQQKALEIVQSLEEKRAELLAKTAQFTTAAGVQQQGQFLQLQQHQDDMRMQMLAASMRKMPIGFRGVEGSDRIPDEAKNQLAKQVGRAQNVLAIADQIKQRNAGDLIKWMGDRFATEQDQAALAVELKEAANFGGALSENEQQFLDMLSGGQFLKRLGMQQSSEWYRDALTRLQARVKLGVKNQLEAWDGVQVTPNSPFYVDTPKPVESSKSAAKPAYKPAFDMMAGQGLTQVK